MTRQIEMRKSLDKIDDLKLEALFYEERFDSIVSAINESDEAIFTISSEFDDKYDAVDDIEPSALQRSLSEYEFKRYESSVSE